MVRMRETRQKELLSAEIRTMHGFFTAEDLFARVSRKLPKMGIATIYRFLNESEKDYSIHTYFCDRRKLYSVNKHSHCHFICEKCGKRKHIEIKDINSIKKSVSGKICHFQIDVYGLCEDCL